MYAIIQDGGHQYRVEKGQRLQLELRKTEAGAALTFEKVCLIGGEKDGPRIGKPYVDGAKVEAKVLRPEVKAKKIEVYFYRRRKGSSRHIGHRQRYTEVEITDISA